jgi:hypothetical protein
MVPVGGALALAAALGVPTGAVAAARTVLDGVERRLDLLVDDSDGVVLGGLRIPSAPDARPVEPVPSPEGHPWLRTTYTSLLRTLGLGPVACGPGPARLRVEVDGATLVDLDQPVQDVAVMPARAGLAEVEVWPVSVGAQAAPVHATGRTVTITGTDFRYRADATVTGPVRRRTWRGVEGAWGLVVPSV